MNVQIASPLATLNSIYEEKAKLGESLLFGLFINVPTLESSLTLFMIFTLTEKCSNSSYFTKFHSPPRQTKFVRKLHTMLSQEGSKGVVEWRNGVLVLLSIERFTEELLPKYFNTHNFKTFRRQLNYYGFVHVRSQALSGSTSATSSTAIWANEELINSGQESSISSILRLRRVEASEASKTPKGRRDRKYCVANSIEVDGLGICVSDIYNDDAMKSSTKPFSPPIPASISIGKSYVQEEEKELEVLGYDPRIDEAAGLLLSILHDH